MATEYLTATEMRDQILERLDTMGCTRQRIIITKHGHPKAVLLSFDDYRGIVATLRLTSVPGAIDRLEQAKEDVRAGRTKLIKRR